eukprot:Partr_v1_DN27465_c0_g1_i4_m72116 putative Translin
MQFDFALVRQELADEAKQRALVEALVEKIDCSHVIAALEANACRIPSSLLDSTKTKLKEFTPTLNELAASPYRYHHMWSRHLQSFIYGYLLVGYLETRSLLGIETVVGAECLSVPSKFVDPEDYLHACVSLGNELARMSVSSVIAGNFQLPVEILDFLTQLFAQFQLLNLKNDSLRRRFDSLKYDVKKVEEVVYSLKLRKFI